MNLNAFVQFLRSYIESEIRKLVSHLRAAALFEKQDQFSAEPLVDLRPAFTIWIKARKELVEAVQSNTANQMYFQQHTTESEMYQGGP